MLFVYFLFAFGVSGGIWALIYSFLAYHMYIVYHIVMDQRTMVFSLTEVLIAGKISSSTSYIVQIRHGAKVSP